ncbi:MAG: anaerobic ribonucleoside-triphosphate reductase activating protein [Fusobacteriaceae bacterium]
MKYLRINECCMLNGDGLRVSIFFSGCIHKCDGCFSEESWSVDAGQEFNEDVEAKVLENINSDYIDGVSILGGDPLHPVNMKGVISFMQKVRTAFPSKTIYLWTGYNLSFIERVCPEVLELTDLIITEKFDIKKSKEFEPLGDYTLRGSSNQKYIIEGKEYQTLPKKFD